MLLSVVRGGKEAAGAVTRREHVHGVETPASTAPHAAQRNPLNYFRSFFYSGLRHVGPCTVRHVPPISLVDDYIPHLSYSIKYTMS